MSARVSDSLVWSIVRKHNAFLYKRGEPASRIGTVQFSAEPGNLLSVNSFKYSGLANSKTIEIAANKDKRIFVNTKAPTKTSKPRKSIAATPLRKDKKRSQKVVKARGGNQFYRPDLASAAVARYNRVLTDVRVRNGASKGARSSVGRAKRTA